MADPRLPSERHYRFHLGRMALGLAFSAATGVAAVIGLVRPGSQTLLVLAPAVVFLVGSLLLHFALRGMRWRAPDPEDRRIRSDERIRANADRSRKLALLTIYSVQVPLIALVAYLPPGPPSAEAAAVGMALLTMACGSAAFFASYLFFSRRDARG